MFKGFYNLTSAMLTHQQNLNVIANNMVNVSTAGFKQERYTATTFDDVMYSLVGNKYKEAQEIGRQSYIRAASDIVTDFTQGIPEPTDLPLDFAIQGDGFFAVQNPDGETFYTRMGNCSLDDDGYLCLPGYGQVLDDSGAPIYLGTDKIECSKQGEIMSENGEFLGRLGVYRFEDNAALERNDQGFFTGDGAQPSENFSIWHKYLERSNSDMVKQMTEMITYQRALQSAAQISKMYDQLMSRVSSEVGRM